MPKWKSPHGPPPTSPNVAREIYENPNPIDVLVMGALGNVPWRTEVLRALDSVGLVYHAPPGIVVPDQENLPPIGCVLVGLGDPGSGNAGLEMFFALTHHPSRWGSENRVVYTYGDLGPRFTPHDRAMFGALKRALSMGRTYMTESANEAARACAVHRVSRSTEPGEGPGVKSEKPIDGM